MDQRFGSAQIRNSGWRSTARKIRTNAGSGQNGTEVEKFSPF